MAFDVYVLDNNYHILGIDADLTAVRAVQATGGLSGDIGDVCAPAIVGEECFIFGDTITGAVGSMLKCPADLSAPPVAFGEQIVQPPPGVFGSPPGTPTDCYWYQADYDPTTGLLVATSQYFQEPQSDIGEGFFFAWDPATGDVVHIWWPADTGPYTFVSGRSTAAGGKFGSLVNRNLIGSDVAIVVTDIATGVVTTLDDIGTVTGGTSGDYDVSILNDGRIAVTHHGYRLTDPVTVTFYQPDGTVEHAVTLIPPTGFPVGTQSPALVRYQGDRIYTCWVTGAGGSPSIMAAHDAATGAVLFTLDITTYADDVGINGLGFPHSINYAMPVPDYRAKPGAVGSQFYSYGPTGVTSAGRNHPR